MESGYVFEVDLCCYWERGEGRAGCYQTVEKDVRVEVCWALRFGKSGESPAVDARWDNCGDYLIRPRSKRGFGGVYLLEVKSISECFSAFCQKAFSAIIFETMYVSSGGAVDGSTLSRVEYASMTVSKSDLRDVQRLSHSSRQMSPDRRCLKDCLQCRPINSNIQEAS